MSTPDDSTGSAQAKFLRAHSKDLGGFTVRRLLPHAQRRMVGPWVFFDHLGAASFPAGKGIDVRPHPHIGIATVTYLFEGEILHRDSLGSLRAIRPGDINLMVAGKGIVHSEREREEVRNQPHNLHGLQLWLALPVEQEEIEPAFYHYPEANVPKIELGGVPVRVMMGSAYGLHSPVETYADTLYIEAALKAEQKLILPEAEELAVYVAVGAVKLGDVLINEGEMLVLGADRSLLLVGEGESRVAIIGGENIGPRFVEWNFVSSRKERIALAKQQWQNQKFDKVVGDELEFIPLPD